MTMTNHDKRHNDLIGDILNRSETKGKIDHLEGAGKPLSKTYLSEDTFQHFQRIAKDAGYKPDWLRRQHEIRDKLIKLASEAEKLDDKALNQFVKEINRDIVKYNKSCPPPFLKGKVKAETVLEAYKIWQ